MSYILDALKRAEAERERGQVPGLNAQPVPMAPAPAKPGRWGLWLALLGSTAVLAAGALYWPAGQTQAVAPAMVAPAPAAAPQPLPPAVPLPAPAPTPVAVPAPVPSVREAPPVQPPAAAAPAPAAVPAPPATVAKPAHDTRRPASAAAAPAPIPALAELPDDLRRDVPKLVVSGSVYSENPAQRMLIVNGQVVNEGASLGPGLVLESIGPKSAVLRLRGAPFRLVY